MFKFNDGTSGFCGFRRKYTEIFFSAKIIASLIVMLNCVLVYGQDPSDIESFQRFFQQKNQPHFEKELITATTQLDYAIQISDMKAEAKAMKVLGLLHLLRTHDYEKAMDFFVQSLVIEDSLNLKTQQILSYVGIAKVFEVVGDYYKSAQFLNQALKINESLRDINILAMILNNLGKVNASMGKVEEGFENYEQVLEYKDEINQTAVAEALFNLGHLYTQQGKYPEALSSHKAALAITRSTKDKRTEALSLNDIGEVYRLMNNEEKSLANHIVALEIRQALNDKQGMAESHNSIGMLYYKQKNTDKAIENILLALNYGRESQAQEQIFKSYDLLSQLYKELEDYKNALAYKELSLAINEFIQNEKQERELLETQNRYVLGKKENQIEKLEVLRADREKEIEAQKKFKNLLIVLITLSLVIGLLILFLYLLKRKSNLILRASKDEVQRQNLKLQELNNTKDKFFSIISHDLKGPLNSLTSFSRLLIDHTDNMTKADIQMLATDLDKSVKNLFALLENLLEWARSQTGTIDFTPEIFDLGGILEMNKNLFESQSKSKQIIIVSENNQECLVNGHKHSMNTVVRNLISNAIKFTNPGGIITLDIQTKNTQVMVSVTDTGVGMSKEVITQLFRLDKKYSSKGTANEKGTGLGLILCKEFIENNGGQISVESEPGKGSKFTISFPQTLLSCSPNKTPEPISFI